MYKKINTILFLTYFLSGAIHSMSFGEFIISPVNASLVNTYLYSSELMQIAETGDTNELNKLISQGVNLDNIDPQDGNTALILATINRHVALALALIKSGANINISNNKKETALMKAAYANETDICYALLKAHVNINAEDQNGHNALYYSARNKHLYSTVLLLAYNIPIKEDLRDNPFILKAQDYLQKVKATLNTLSTTNSTQDTLHDISKQFSRSFVHYYNPLNVISLETIFKELDTQVPLDTVIDEQGNTLLHKAIKSALSTQDAHSIIKALLAVTPSLITIENGLKLTPVQLTLSLNKIDLLKCLLGEGYTKVRFAVHDAYSTVKKRNTLYECVLI